MWIHEYPEWTDFTWDIAKIGNLLARVRYHQGRIIGRITGLGMDLQREANLGILTEDVVKSSAIEGEKLNPEEVRSSIAKRLGINLAENVETSRAVKGIVEMMLDATQNYSQPLTQDRLFGWHASLFPSGRSGMNRIQTGRWRTADIGAMQVVSGPVGKEKVHFEAPFADRLGKEMQQFLKWFEDPIDTDPVLKAGIAHLWFVTIHPFEDRNGRIARAIADMALSRADKTPLRCYSLSSQIESERKDYYSQLEQQQRSSPNITDWLLWFLRCMERAIARSENELNSILKKAKLWEFINHHSIHDRQRTILKRMMEDSFEGHMNTSKYAKMVKCSTDTALRDIQYLTKNSILVQNPGGGRSTSYRLADPS
jgi:Fic family protein